MSKSPTQPRSAALWLSLALLTLVLAAVAWVIVIGLLRDII